MSDTDKDQWRPMDTAPLDGTRILGQVRASEQGPAALDIVRWAKPEHAADPCWISDDSEPDCQIVYAEIELTGWVPVTEPMPKLRRSSVATEAAPASGSEEIAGSGI